MYTNKPKMAERFEKHTPKGKDLPEKVGSAFFRGFVNELGKVAEEEIGNEPSGLIGIILRAMKKAGKGGSEKTIGAFRRLAYNVPTNK